MKTLDIRSIEEFPQIAELYVPPIYLSHPKIYQKFLVPEDLLQQFEQRWSVGRIVIPRIKFFLLKNVYVTAEGLVFTADGSFVKETKTNHSDQDVAVSFEELTMTIACGEKIPGHQQGILCKKRGAENYGHWLVEMLPKAFLAARELNLSDDWPAIVFDTNGRLNVIMRESLEVIGFGANKIIFTDKKPAFFEQIIIVDGLTSHANFMSPVVFECMEFIASKAAPGTAEKLYVTRRTAKSRQFENDNEIYNFFAEQGYKEIDCGELPFLEQVGMFKTAKKMAGPMGAAFSNAVFSTPNTQFILFMPATAHEYFFWHIAEGKKLEYHEIRCQESGPQKGSLPWNRNMYVSPTTLEMFFACQQTKESFEQLASSSEEEKICTHLINGKWNISFSHSPDTFHPIRFNRNGKIDLYQHHNENSWRVRSGSLEILDYRGQVSWTFSVDKAITSAKLTGAFNLDSNKTVIAYITKS